MANIKCLLCNNSISLSINASSNNKTGWSITGGYIGVLKDKKEICLDCYNNIILNPYIGIKIYYFGIKINTQLFFNIFGLKKFILKDLNSHDIFSYDQKQEQDRIIKKEDKKNYEARKKDLIKKYGEKDGNKILNEKIWIGMTKKMLIDSWGNPSDRKENVSKEKVKLKFYYNPRKTRQGTTVYKYEVRLENNIVIKKIDL